MRSQLIEAQPGISQRSTCLSRVNAVDMQPLRHPAALQIGPKDHHQLFARLFGLHFQRIEGQNGHMKQHTHIREIDRYVCSVHPQPDGHGMGRYPALSWTLKFI